MTIRVKADQSPMMLLDNSLGLTVCGRIQAVSGASQRVEDGPGMMQGKTPECVIQPQLLWQTLMVGTNL
jgi:hypothetical protein